MRAGSDLSGLNPYGDMSGHAANTERLEDPRASLIPANPTRRIPLGDNYGIIGYDKRVKEEAQSFKRRHQRNITEKGKLVGSYVLGHVGISAAIYTAASLALSYEGTSKISKEALILAKNVVGENNALIDTLMPKVQEFIENHPFIAANIAGLSISGKQVLADARKVLQTLIYDTVAAPDPKAMEKQKWVNSFYLFEQDIKENNVLARLDPEDKRIFEEKFERLRLSILDLGNLYTNFHDFTDVKNVWENLMQLMKYPTETEDVYLYGKYGDRKAAKALDALQEKELEAYPSIKKEWNEFLNSSRAWLVTRTGAPPFARLVSGPSTGKTEAIKRTGKEILKAEVIVATQKDLEKFLGVNYGYERSTTLKEEIGSILNTIVEKAKTKNYILLLDEFDLSEPQRQFLYDAIKLWINGDNSIDPKHPTFQHRPDLRCPVAIGTNKKEIHDPAIKSRIGIDATLGTPSKETAIQWLRDYLQNGLIIPTKKADKHFDENIDNAARDTGTLIEFMAEEREKYVNAGFQDDLTVRVMKEAMKAKLFVPFLYSYDRGDTTDLKKAKQEIANTFKDIAEIAGWKAPPEPPPKAVIVDGILRAPGWTPSKETINSDSASSGGERRLWKADEVPLSAQEMKDKRLQRFANTSPKNV